MCYKCNDNKKWKITGVISGLLFWISICLLILSLTMLKDIPNIYIMTIIVSIMITITFYMIIVSICMLK